MGCAATHTEVGALQHSAFMVDLLSLGPRLFNQALVSYFLSTGTSHIRAKGDILK